MKTEWLSNAPTYKEVREHILFLCGRPISTEAAEPDEECLDFDPAKHSIFIAHGAHVDLKVMDIFDVPYFCTLLVDNPLLSQHRKLKDLCLKYLNAQI